MSVRKEASIADEWSVEARGVGQQHDHVTLRRISEVPPTSA